MDIANLKMCHKQRVELNITAQDLNESDDPLENILIDVMFDRFYKQTTSRNSQLAENRTSRLLAPPVKK